MTAVLPKVTEVMSQQTNVTLEASARAHASCFLRGMTARQGHAAGVRKCKVSMSIIIRHAGPLLTGNVPVLVCARGMRLAVNIQRE